MAAHDSRPQHPPAPRRAWLAALLALLVPGLGHLYLGQPRRGLAIYLSWFAPPLLLVSLATWLGWNLAAVTLATTGASLLIWLAQLAWAAALARRLGASFRARRYNHAAVYIAALLASLGLDTAVTAALRAHVTETFRVASSSMAPTLLPGDLVFVRKAGARLRALEPGDVVMVMEPESGEIYAKRIVAIGGDTVEERDGVVVVNNTPLARVPCEPPSVQLVEHDAESGRSATVELQCWRETSAGGRSYSTANDPRLELSGRDFAPLQVPPGALFVLGDFRSNSLDSRQFGPIAGSRVVGLADSIYLTQPPAGGLRLDRVGQRVR